MKYFLAGLCLISIILIFIFVPLGSSEQQVEYLRIHIRANSNEQVDQEVKYKVKDEIVDALIPLLSDVDSFEKATKVIENNFDLADYKNIVDDNYKSKLQELLQQNFKCKITYDTQSQNSGFISYFYMDEDMISFGEGKSKIEAEQQAAKKAIEKLFLKF